MAELLDQLVETKAGTDDTCCGFDHCSNRANWIMHYKGLCHCPRETSNAACELCVIQYRDADIQCTQCGWIFIFGKVEKR